MTSADGASRLERWSRAHALVMLSTTAIAVIGEPRVLAAAAALTLSWLVARERAQFFARGWPANAVTAWRAALVVSLPIVVDDCSRPTLAALTALILALDGLDGWIARRLRAPSSFGAHFDMETDALFVLVVELALWRTGQAGPWILVTGLLRYVYVLWTALSRSNPPPAPRSRFGRHAFLTLALGLIAAWLLPWPSSAFVAAAASLPVVYSFAHSFWGSRRASAGK